jgi:uncharacterized protein YhaN
MEILKLDLTAFGPFTDQTLDFDHESGALHIVYGPNEAGKSSALRGLKSLLYGIEERTTDNFVHSNERLRIGGRLKTAANRQLSFERRKGRKNTLLSPTREPLDDVALTPYLQGVTPELFETLFGIDHSALVRGGQEILAQKGEVGQALFAAALGSTALHTVLDQLDKEADEHFRPRGSTQTVNVALKDYSRLNKEIKEVSLSSHQWDEYRRALARTVKELEEVRAKLAKDRAQVTRLRRIQRVLPKLARRAGLSRTLEDFGDVVLLSDDFRKRRQDAAVDLGKAQAIHHQAEPRLKDLKEQLGKIVVRQEVIEQAEAIEVLHERLGSHRKAMQDRPRREAERHQLFAEVEFLLKDIRPDLASSEVEVLRPVLARRVRITDLGNQRQALITRVKQTHKNSRDTQKRLEKTRRLQQELPKAVSPEALRRAVLAARKVGDRDRELTANRNELQQLETQGVTTLARLSLWSGSVADVPSLKIPTRESVERFEQAYDGLVKREEKAQEKRDELLSDLHELSKQLDEIQCMGKVPTEHELEEARHQRDYAWRLLRRQWVEGQNVQAESHAVGPDLTLPDAYERRVADADEVADRLRREADRVRKQASLLAEQSEHKHRIEEFEKQLKNYADQRAQLNTDWQSLWSPCNITPQPPREMRAWLERFEKLRENVEQLSVLRQKTEELARIHEAHVRSLRQALYALGKDVSHYTMSFEAMHAVGEEVLAEVDETQRQYKQLDKDIESLERDLETAYTDHQSASTELADWNIQWQEAVAGLGLGPDALPSEANERIEKLRELFLKLDDNEKLRIQIHKIDEEANEFRAQVSGLVALVAPELTRLSAEQAVVRLNAVLAENRTSLSQRQQLESQLKQTHQELRDTRAEIDMLSVHLRKLCDEARCNDPDKLEAAERRSAEYAQLKNELKSVERELLETGEGATLAELEKEAEGADADTLPGRIQELTGRIQDELDPCHNELANSKGRQEKELELMDGSDRAARLADEAQATLARIRASAERYVRAKLAARILRQEIERFRKENQGPLVKKASEHFAALTQGSFEALRTDFDEKDEPILVGIRPNGEIVHVEGMSSGTRDQLYLALRLASLEKFMEKAEPMPFIVDDILIHFDDERSKATLKVLAELATKTQVILFTHHSRLLEQAEVLDGHVRVHHL